MAQQTNQAGLDLIKTYEGCKLDAYQDVKGIWTIGYGHIRGVVPGMHLTSAQAEEVLKDDLRGTEAAVSACIGNAATTSDQFSAMVSLCFNIGSGNFRQSSVLAQHLAGHFQQAADAFLLWNKARIDGVLTEVKGLTNRRTSERDLYLRKGGEQ
jgi:lysozyme